MSSGIAETDKIPHLVHSDDSMVLILIPHGVSYPWGCCFSRTANAVWNPGPGSLLA